MIFNNSVLMSRWVRVVSISLLAVSLSNAEGKSAWQKFVDFFSPTSEVEGEGELYDQLRELDRKINRVEGKYARERRPMNKERYKKELAQLKEEREVLLKKIEAEEAKKPGSSSQVAQSSSSMTSSSAQKVASSSSVVPVVTCQPETVYVRDTVVVHDTLYVMLANKPEPAPVSSAEAVSASSSSTEQK